jgi:predicted Kef-type K+ transport protein
MVTSAALSGESHEPAHLGHRRTVTVVLLIVGIRVAFGSSQVTNWAIAGGAILIGLYWVVFRKGLKA